MDGGIILDNSGIISYGGGTVLYGSGIYYLVGEYKGCCMKSGQESPQLWKSNIMWSMGNVMHSNTWPKIQPSNQIFCLQEKCLEL